MKIVIDTNVLAKMGISTDLAMYLFSIYLGNPIDSTEDLDVFKKASKAGYIMYTRYSPSSGPKEVTLEPDGMEVIEKILAMSKAKKDIDDDELRRYTALAEKMQELYPEGTKPGTHEKWQGNESLIGERILSVAKKFNLTFTDEEAIQACKEYVDSFKADKTTMHVLKYFIYKNDIKSGVREYKSMFADYLRSVQKGQKETINRNWNNDLR